MTNPTPQVRLARPQALGSARAGGTPITAGADALFVYGTLRFPRILSALLGRVPTGTPATVTGWRTAELKGRPYPGLVAAPGSTASGLLLSGLTAREWRVLDDFEDNEYDLRSLPLDGPVADGAPRSGWAYTWESPDEVRPGNWDPDVFAARVLDTYAARLEAGG
ncbi:gamma-glutamylcyclotransferase family protein [Streptomyces boncukensis]|uniref:Putative gamma-glutamylcyclotransferase n=1 Tax=Streptomyces boncukensis TaxID=2711219 RepID=A0A6G4X4J6_9ACTN|nr:gamma-glutamylcyclotransferase family protein [Streptomyces boncukensis]NGO71800.1 gamma-glutamylcyclotransferase [Streptomyces boncukensis]